MANQDPEPHPQQLHDQQQLGDAKLINGRQCRRCSNWFRIEWLAYHDCPVNPRLRLFDPPA